MYEKKERYIYLFVVCCLIFNSSVLASPDDSVETAIIHFQNELIDETGEKKTEPAAIRYCDFKNERYRQDIFRTSTKSWHLEKIAISDKGYVINHINNTAMEILDIEFDPAALRLLYYTKKPLRIDQIAGQNCNVYIHSGYEVCLWKGIPIRTIGKILGVDIHNEVSKIEINPTIEENTFNLPKEIKIVSTARGLVDSVTQLFKIGKKLKKEDPKILEKFEQKLLEIEKTTMHEAQTPVIKEK